MKCICFKLTGDYGHYRPYYTTSSPTTYSLMPPTSIYGLIGAMLGLSKDNNNYYKDLESANTRVGIGLITPVKKIAMSTNLINTKNNYWVPTNKNSSGPRTPTRFEYVVGQEYLVFITMSDEILLDELAKRLERHCFAYGISLGLSNLIADAQLICYDSMQKVNGNDYIEMDSAVPTNKIEKEKGIKVLSDIKYCKERYVRKFGENRIPLDYVDALFSTNARKISVKCSEVYKLDNFYFSFLT
ncbi:CRISPR-associated protein Cas5 [Sedimentibacter hydroxybenzoicus DSM 7310]|uniref:CRISPR-associated protein Cas5 n=1 Tax=Sedimentibacter hydroxybenzoicus DSM 7310 TaxID=1123245 RepID=A0A974BNB1_SEDHY|nr:CRISPR-associated protein Cas5 [Sedimentibacter hydroxybenzoicus]NYB76121.1 CRISPR-associated protein Cas5 [Sedimentibacter hydroxybenzoicus DSM 7310]